MLFEVKGRLKGLKHNIDIGGRGWEDTGERDTYVHYAKKAILQKFLNTIVPHCSFPTTKLTRNTVIHKTTLDTYLSSGIPSIFKADKHWWSLDVNQVNKTVCNRHDRR